MSVITKNQTEQTTFIIVSDRINNANKLIASPSNFQVGLKQVPADLTVMGKTSTKGELCLSTKIYREDSTVDLDATVALIYGGGSLKLPKAISSGHYLCIKDADGSALANPIVISSSAGDPVDGSNSTSISTNYGYKILSWYSNQWFVLSSS